MSGSIEEVAKSWLADPAWQKVFKTTFDVLVDYVTYVMVAVGAVALSVRLLTTLATGDLACIVVGVKDGTSGSLRPFPEASAIGLMQYAQTDQSCIQAVYTTYFEYLPFIMLLQILLLVIVEKFTFKIPRIAQKVERFYKNIVEDSLFGKDPDVAEDMTDPKTSTDSISRRRQRNEVCISLKRSSSIYNVYIAKNIVKVLLVLFFLPENISNALATEEEGESCSIEVDDFPGVTENETRVFFQCRGKKLSFFLLVLWLQIFLLALHGILSLCALVWCWKFRAVTELLKTVERVIQLERKASLSHEGRDFLFLFDLLAHSCGLESTLRVLTHSDQTFYEICKPNLPSAGLHLSLEEDKLKVSWKPADIERWLHAGKRSMRSQRSIRIDSYEVTIFPAETTNNTKTVEAFKNLNCGVEVQEGKDEEMALMMKEDLYQHWFYDLNGGRTEYVITIACMIGRSRMKGEKIVTNLVPYGPEKPRSGMMKSAGINQIEIFWDPPKGDFTKYTLVIDSMINTALSTNSLHILRMTSVTPDHSHSNNLGKLSRKASEAFGAQDFSPALRQMENLSSKLTCYTILGLLPGERYKVELGTKTGSVTTRQPITDVVMTKPQPVTGLSAHDVTTSNCVIRWLLPDHGHACLKGFSIQVVTLADGKTVKDLAVRRDAKSMILQDLAPATDYNVRVTSKCTYAHLKTESDPAETRFTTLPEPVRNLRADTCTSNSIMLKWDPASAAAPAGATVLHRLTLECDEIDLRVTNDVAGDKQSFNFTKLPSPDGTGKLYSLTIVTVVTSWNEVEVRSRSQELRCWTLPMRPGEVQLGARPCEIKWQRSQTPAFFAYRLRYWEKDVEGAAKVASPVDVPVDEADISVYASAVLKKLQPGVTYKVSISAVVRFEELDGVEAESKPTCEEVVLADDGQLAIKPEEEKQ